MKIVAVSTPCAFWARHPGTEQPLKAWHDEARHYPIEAPDPIEAIRFRMEQGGLTVKDLVPSIGQPNHVYEVLNRKRGLTIDMIRKLHHNLGIPAESLIGV